MADTDITATTSEAGLTRITINVTAQALPDLIRITDGAGMSKTSAINRAIRLAALVDSLLDASGALRVTRSDGTVEHIYLL